MVRLPVYRNVSQYANKFWHLLTTPSSLLLDPAQRRQAYFLAAVLGILMPIALVTSFIRDITIQQGTISAKSSFAITTIALILGLFAYGLSRTRYYHIAGHIVVATASFAVFGSIFRETGFDVHTLSFLILPLLLSSILLSLRATWLWMVLQFIVLGIVVYLHPEVAWGELLYANIQFQLFAGIFILLSMYFRNRIENEQNQLIQRNELMMRQTNEELEKRVVDRTAAYQMATEELIELLNEREKYENELAKERNLLRTVIDNVPDHIFVLDRAGNYILANSPLVQSFAQNDIEFVLGKSVFDYFPDAQAKQFFDEELSIMENGQAKLNVEQTTNFDPKLVRSFLASKLDERDCIVLIRSSQRFGGFCPPA